jgi:hypothetical protein
MARSQPALAPPMVPAQPPKPAGARAPRHRPARQVRSWRGWLLLGLCFGLGYGVTHRLVALDLGGGTGGNQRFGVKPFPGTGLDALRQRYGAEGQGIRGDLEKVEREHQQKQAEKEGTERRAELEEQERARQEQQQRQEERARLEELSRPETAAPAPREPETRLESPLLSPPEAVPAPPPPPEAAPAPQP